MSIDVVRVPAGVPSGGQFAASTRDEADVRLAPPVPVVEPMDLEDAVGWWYEDGSFAIATGAVDLLGDCHDDWEGWNLPDDATEFKRDLAEESRQAAAALLAAAEPFDHAVSHGTGRTLDVAVGGTYRIPLLATSDDEETVEHFAQATSEDGVGVVWDFPEGATGVRINGSEWVVTGDYVLTGRHVDDAGVEHCTLVSA